MVQLSKRNLISLITTYTITSNTIMPVHVENRDMELKWDTSGLCSHQDHSLADNMLDLDVKNDQYDRGIHVNTFAMHVYYYGKRLTKCCTSWQLDNRSTGRGTLFNHSAPTWTLSTAANCKLHSQLSETIVNACHTDRTSCSPSSEILVGESKY